VFMVHAIMGHPSILLLMLLLGSLEINISKMSTSSAPEALFPCDGIRPMDRPKWLTVVLCELLF